MSFVRFATFQSTILILVLFLEVEPFYITTFWCQLFVTGGIRCNLSPVFSLEHSIQTEWTRRTPLEIEILVPAEIIQHQVMGTLWLAMDALLYWQGCSHNVSTYACAYTLFCQICFHSWQKQYSTVHTPYSTLSCWCSKWFSFVGGGDDRCIHSHTCILTWKKLVTALISTSC